ncbi:MAG: hypothetical protein CVT67_05960 [Actinobacteria bacterium HGW-Actinobacteria-7]|nr:MAG: hypothetical protein CVT67_05960 [Actinobacteria bacterium HGW-Actinobacteria-7]
MTRSSAAQRTTNILSSIVTTVVILVLLNEAAQYSIAWSRIVLASRDSRDAVSLAVQKAPADRDAASRAAQAAAAGHHVVLVTYGHEMQNATLGPRVDASMQFATPARWAMISGIAEAIRLDGPPSTWRSHTPTITYTYDAQFSTYQ